MGGWVRPNAYVCLQAGWVGVAKCLCNHKNFLKKSKLTSNKTAWVCKFLRLIYILGKYKFDNYCQIVHFSYLNEKKIDLPSQFPHQKSVQHISENEFKCSFFEFLVAKRSFQWNIFKKHVKSCFLFTVNIEWKIINSTIIKGNVNILKSFCWKKQMGGLFKTFFIVPLYYC